MNFGQSETYEIPELLQLDLSQSEVQIPRYNIMKVARSAEFTDSDSSNVSIIASGICTG
jgi:enoyl-[acyl-carrier-protein] reductase (NADH)